MPYKTNKDLPRKIKEKLSREEQTIYRKAYNLAWRKYKRSSSIKSDLKIADASHKIAWITIQHFIKKTR
jgi:cation transport regulator ChaB